MTTRDVAILPADQGWTRYAVTSRCPSQRDFIDFFIGVPIFIIRPWVTPAWIGSRIRWPLFAFVVTPAITVLGIPILRAIMSLGNDGSGVIMLPLPFVGVLTGLVAAIVAADVVKRRMRREKILP